MNEFEEKVKIASIDLRKYPEKELSKLAEKWGVKCNDKKCEKIAEKLMFIHTNKIPTKCVRYLQHLDSESINQKRDLIYKKYSHFEGKVTTITSKELREIIEDYDTDFFGGEILDKNNVDIKTLGKDTFTTEGRCIEKMCEYTITIPVEKIKIYNPTMVAGHICNTDLDCLLRVIEHEISHLILFMFCGDQAVSDVHGPLFKNFIKDNFDHTDYHHNLF